MSSLTRLVDPASIAIAGLSADPRKHGARVLANLRRLGYTGRIWGVNPGRPEIDGVEMFADVRDLPAPPDLVVAAVPAAVVADVVRGCEGVGSVVVFASGFAETGSSGKQAEESLAAIAGEVGTRLLGPNSGGVIRPGTGLAASFLTCLDRPPEQLRTGPVAVVTQSGGTGSYLNNLAAARNEGIALTVSTGNESDIQLGEALEAMTHIDEVEVVLAVVETIRDGDRFLDAVRSAHSAGIRVVVCPLGRGEKSETLMTSHTGALAIPGVVSTGVFSSLGVVTAETPAEAYDIASVLARSKPTSTRGRVGIVTHSGGIAIHLADLAESSGLHLEDPSPSLRSSLQAALDHGSATNPLDMGGIIGGPSRFAEIVSRFADSGEYDAVLAVSTAHPPAHTQERVESLIALEDRPIVHLWMAGDQGAAGLARLREAGLAVTEETRAAIRAMAALTTGLPEADTPPPIEGPPGTWGLALDFGTIATTADEAITAAARIGYPVVVKLESEMVSHKSDIGGVHLDLRTPMEVEVAHRELTETAKARGWPDARLRVQRYRPGTEMIIGGIRHETFGPMVSVGIGGILAETIDDVVFALAPVGIPGARSMIDRLRGRSLLDGQRGAGPADVDALAAMVSLVSRGIDGSDVLAFEMNPVIWDGTEWVVVDWLVE